MTVSDFDDTLRASVAQSAYTVLEVTHATFDEIAATLRKIGLKPIWPDLIDMHGMGLQRSSDAYQAGAIITHNSDPIRPAAQQDDLTKAVDLLRRLQTPGESAQARFDAAAFLRAKGIA